MGAHLQVLRRGTLGMARALLRILFPEKLKIRDISLWVIPARVLSRGIPQVRKLFRFVRNYGIHGLPVPLAFISGKFIVWGVSGEPIYLIPAFILLYLAWYIILNA